MKKLFTLGVIAILTATFAYAASSLPLVKTYYATEFIVGNTVLSPTGSGGASAFSSFFTLTDSDMNSKTNYDSYSRKYTLSYADGGEQFFKMTTNNNESIVISVGFPQITSNPSDKSKYDGLGQLTLYFAPQRFYYDDGGSGSTISRYFDLVPYEQDPVYGVVGIPGASTGDYAPWVKEPETGSVGDYIWQLNLKKYPGSTTWVLIDYKQIPISSYNYSL